MGIVEVFKPSLQNGVTLKVFFFFFFFFWPAKTFNSATKSNYFNTNCGPSFSLKQKIDTTPYYLRWGKCRLPNLGRGIATLRYLFYSYSIKISDMWFCVSWNSHLAIWNIPLLISSINDIQLKTCKKKIKIISGCKFPWQISNSKYNKFSVFLNITVNINHIHVQDFELK